MTPAPPSPDGHRDRLWQATLALAPVLLRLALVPFVDDPDADGYSRALIARDLAAAVRDGHATWGSLYVAVWPPAWALLCAAVDLLGADPYLGPKALSAIFGGLTAVLCHPLARRLGAPPRTARLAWLLATVSPLHVLYSSTAMTEAFYGFWFLLACLAFLRAERDNRWLYVAALALVPAGLTRFDAWILFPVVPLLALRQRRASLGTAAAATAILALVPLAWAALNQAARGHPLAFLGTHGEYVAHFFAQNPAYADRGLAGAGLHLGAMLTAVGATVTGLAILGFVRVKGREARALLVLVGVTLAWLLVLWALRKQAGWRRYYLATGLPLTVMAALAIGTLRRPRPALALVALELLVLTGVDAWMARWPARLRQTAAFLATADGTVLTDEPGVELLARLPPDRVVDTLEMPRTRAGALEFLRARGVRWVVFSDVDYSPLPEVFPRLREARDDPPLRLAFRSSVVRPLPQILVYRVD